MQIGSKDVLWNYAATFLKIGSSAILLPLILKMMPADTVGIWSIFTAITAFSTVFDFGFNPSFTRNVTYVFSGVSSIKSIGFETISIENEKIDFSLLKGVISTMRYFYSRMALVLFFFLITLGTFYIHTLLQKYNGDHKDVYIAWLLLCTISSYNLFTLYYESLLLGKGLVKKSKQIVIIGQAVYLVVATILIIAGYGLIAIVSAQAFSVIIIRWLSYKNFFTIEIKESLKCSSMRSKKEVLKSIYPNALKLGLTALGGILVQRSAIIIGSLYLDLKDVASYGITIQFIYIITNMSGIYISTFQPKLTQWQVVKNYQEIKVHYIRGQALMIFTYFSGALGLLICGPWALNLIGSKTTLMSTSILIVALIASLIDSIQYSACIIILSKNIVPFFKTALLTGAFSISLLFLLFQYSNIGLWAMILAPFIAQSLYQNWKWPLLVVDDLHISFQDVLKVMKRFNVLKYLK